MLARLSLRTRLVLGVIVLAAVGLVVADVATYASLRSFLIDRTDATLDAAHVGVEHALFGSRGRGRTAAGAAASTRSTAAAPGAYIQVRTLDGTVVASGVGPAVLAAARRRRRRGCPRRSRCPTPAGTAVTASRYFTVPAQSGGEPLPRARLDRAAGDATPPDRRDLAERRRQHAPPAAPDRAARDRGRARGARAARALGRPARPAAARARSSETAAAIAAGDLSRRVERADERTEVGRLGLALNAMLGQIERRSGRARRPSGSCAASSPTPRTSCGRRSRPCAPTPSCSRAAPTHGPTTSRAR